ncbi:MAG TPA: hypothetical protein VJU16_01390 [Planctomycetota bacterium]|nr:hypothetical protein [Planctomycetota bacterium]
MIWILLLALAQGPGPEKSIEGHVEAFLKGDAASRTELLRLGISAIRPLQKVRTPTSRKIDALLFEIKSAAAYPSPVVLPAAFGDRGGMTSNRQWPDPGELVRLFQEKGIPVFTDQFDATRLSPTRMAIFNPGSPLQLVEMFCQDTGLDYGFFHNSVVIGLPERLWTDRPLVKTSPLTEAEAAQARDWIKQLQDPSIDTRESASRSLVGLGRGVVSLVEAGRKQADPEVVSRCDAILRVLGRGGSSFGPAACLRQKLSGEDETLLAKLKSSKPRMALDKAKLSDVLGAFQSAHGVTFEIDPVQAGKFTTVHTSGQTLLDLLSLVSQSHDLDFIIANGKVLIEGRRAIEKRVAPEK